MTVPHTQDEKVRKKCSAMAFPFTGGPKVAVRRVPFASITS